MTKVSETEYTESLDWAKVKPTMMVELRHKEYTAVAGKVGSIHQYDRHHVGVWVEGAWRNERDGWSLWVKPEPGSQSFGVAPTTGIWLDGVQDVWETQGRTATLSQKAWDEYGPWTELLTEAEWSAKRPREGAVRAAMHALADEFDARLPDGTSNGRAYNSYTVASKIRLVLAATQGSKPQKHYHKPIQHRDNKRPWCAECGLDAEGIKP